MTALDDDIRRALDATPLAYVATVGPDGAPHVTPVWIGTRGEQVVWFTGRSSRKARNLRRDRRIAISLVAGDDYTPVVVRGRVREWVDGDAGWQIVDDIARKYTGGPYSREYERIAAVVEVEVQRIGLG